MNEVQYDCTVILLTTYRTSVPIFVCVQGNQWKHTRAIHHGTTILKSYYQQAGQAGKNQLHRKWARLAGST